MEKDEQIHAIAKEIAKRLGSSWRYESQAENRYACAVSADGRELHFTSSSKSERRIVIRATGWPTYTQIVRGWNSQTQARKESVGPHNLYNPEEETPEASVAIARGIDTIAREIARRVMEPYARIWTRCAEEAARSQRYQDAREAAWKRACEAAGSSPDKPGADFLGLTMTPYDGKHVYFERGGSVAVDEVIVAIEAVNEYRKAKKGAVR